MARPDLLRAVCSLACKVTKWDVDCDADIHRLIEYIHSTHGRRLVGWCGDSRESLELSLYADADFAGDPSAKSTSGCALRVSGPDTRFILACISKTGLCLA